MTSDELRKLTETPIYDSPAYGLPTIATLKDALRQAADEIDRLQAQSDDLLFDKKELCARLGQYEAQYAHDYNIWRASRMGKLEAQLALANDVCEIVAGYTIADNRDGLLHRLEAWRKAKGGEE